MMRAQSMRLSARVRRDFSKHAGGRGQRYAHIIVGLTLLAALVGAAPASAQTGWWHLRSDARPSILPVAVEEEGKVIPGKGEIVITAANLGDGAVSGAISPMILTDKLPEGLTATSIAMETGHGPLACSKPPVLECVDTETLPPYHQIEVVIHVTVGPSAQTGELNQAAVSGGEIPGTATSPPLTISEAATPFGLQENQLALEEETGTPDNRAGSHPFQLTDTIVLNQVIEEVGGHFAAPAALARDVHVKLPPGLLGNPDPFPRCATAQFLKFNSTAAADECPAGTAVGVANVHIDEPITTGDSEYVLPVFNLQPGYGEPARFGFYVPEGHVPVYLDTSIRGGPGTGEEYAITANVDSISQTAAFLSSQVTFWGVPGDPRHNNARGWNCIHEAEGVLHGPCQPLEQQGPQSFLTMPTSCSGPLQSSTELDSWAEPTHILSYATTKPLQSMDGCNQLAFAPLFSAEPTTASTSSPSGLNVDLGFEDEGLTSAEGLAQSQMQSTVVTLPEGFTINPSSGVGLGGCTPADFQREALDSLPGEGCPSDSTLGTVEASTPLLSTPIKGSLFIAQPYENPFPEPENGHPNGTLVALYIVLRNPETGILIKLPAKVTPNPVTGQLVTTVENEPQFPISHFSFHFREGTRAPLITPATCATYTTSALLTPFSEFSLALTDLSSFTITSGVEGGACPSGAAPFAPQITAGTESNSAGSFSPFYLHLTRGDSDQEISSFSTTMPPGLSAILTGIPFCPEADIALARTKTGAEEEANPSCPAQSQLGHTLVGTGVGPVLAYTPGKIYLAGPYNGDPFSLVSITSAVVGPFDLGTVVIRFGLKINPTTAQAIVDPTASEPIPTIIDGIVTHVRDIRVYIDRPNFTFNPTSCNPEAIQSTLSSPAGASSTISSRFQAANCANLKFVPGISFSTSRKTSKQNGADLITKVTYPSASQGTYANVAYVKVELPKALPSRLTTLQRACTSKQFEANPAGCPSESKIGYAIVHTPLLPVPLTGPAIFVSHGGEAFPSLTMVLQGDGVTIDLVGTTFISKAGVTSTTFKTVPDAPFSTFELVLPQGPYSALTANGNLCTEKLVIPNEFLSQAGGTPLKQDSTISVTGCPPAITVVGHKVKGKTATIMVSVPAAGKLVATGKGLSKVTKTAKGTTTLTVKLTLTNDEAALLSKHKGRKLRAMIHLTFSPKKGAKLKTATTVILG